MTLTSDQLNALPPDRLEWIEKDFGTSLAQLAPRYGAARGDWRPLGGQQSIDGVLAEIKREIDVAAGGRRLAWRQPNAEFWTDTAAVRSFARDEFGKGDLSLLVIDPVAICHPDIYQRLMCFRACFGRSQTVIAVLPPFGLPMIAGLKQALLKRAAPYFDDYFEPAIHPKPRLQAQCAWIASGADDIRRHLLVAAGGIVKKPAPSSPYVRQGAGR